MNSEQNYIEINRRLWNDWADAHLNSEFYNLEGFLKGKSSLNDIELRLLGDIKGKSILHLQCHFGQDTISLNRMGAEVTGVDFSDIAIASARRIAKETHSDARFICCDLYDLPNQLKKQFDIVFTSYGTIGWLPDIQRWAKIVSRFLKPNGHFVFAEFHPVVWMFDNHFDKICYSYFNSGAIVETETGTYADRNADLTHESVSWNHSLGDVINSLINNRLEILSFEEYDYSPYDCFNKSVKVASGKYRIEHLDNKIPMVYSLLAKKRGK